MPRATTATKLAGIAEDQWGFVTRRQAEAAGVSPATIQRLSTGGTLQREAHGVYRLAGVPTPDHAPLRSAWLQLAPDTLAWQRGPEQGVVSHRSAAALSGLGHLPADVHEFILPSRRQVRRPDVRIHRGKLADDEWITSGGLPVTKPSRTASDLLADREDPEAVGRVVADALREAKDYPGTFVAKLGPQAGRFGFRRGDGVAVLRWLLDLVGDPETPQWMQEARAAGTDTASASVHQTPAHE